MTFDAGYENRIFPITLIVIVLVLVLVLILGGGYWYFVSQKSEFEAVYAQLGIQPLPSTVERQQQFQARLSLSKLRSS
jgi:flagellar basal body-associated protein FliL